MSVVLCQLAANPNTDPALLEKLTDYARTRNAGVRRKFGTAIAPADPQKILVALASNPALAPELVSSLCEEKSGAVRQALLLRSDTDAAFARQLLTKEKRPSLLRAAAAHVPDPDGSLCFELMNRLPDRGQYVAVLMNPDTTNEARAHAAWALGPLLELQREVAWVAAAAKRDAALAFHLHAWLQSDPTPLHKSQHPTARLRLEAVIAKLVEKLSTPLPDRAITGRWKRNQVAAWLAAPGRTHDEVCAYAKLENRETLLREVATSFDDPTGDIATLLMDRSPARTVATAVLLNRQLPVPVRRRAAIRVASNGTSLTPDLSAAAVEIVRHDLATAIAAVPACGSVEVLLAALEHRTLPGETVHLIAEKFGLLESGQRVFGCTPYVRELMTLATHPAAPLDVALAAQKFARTPRGRFNNQYRRDTNLFAWLEAAVSAKTSGLEAAAATLPANSVRYAVAACINLPLGMADLFTAATAPAMAGTDPKLLLTVLASLDEDFPGTITELVETSAAILAGNS